MSKMKKCKKCNADIASKAKSCPSCGAKNKKPIYKRAWFWLLVIIIGVSIASTVGNDGSEKADKPETSKSETTPKKEDTKITYDNFINIQMGQSYEDVVSLLGEGKQTSSSEIAGIKTTIYTWTGKGISNIMVTIQNDLVSGKAQAGLNTLDADITLEKYDQVLEGMTYDEVKSILGEGHILSETQIMDMKSTMYIYSNKNGSNANFTFTNDSLLVKAQFNLK